MGKRYEAGRERDGMEPVEYCERRFFAACAIEGGTALVGLLVGDVISGGSAGWLGSSGSGEDTAGGDGAGDERGDMTAIVSSGAP